MKKLVLGLAVSLAALVSMSAVAQPVDDVVAVQSGDQVTQRGAYAFATFACEAKQTPAKPAPGKGGGKKKCVDGVATVSFDHGSADEAQVAKAKKKKVKSRKKATARGPGDEQDGGGGEQDPDLRRYT